jgi:hypothetical protein
MRGLKNSSLAQLLGLRFLQCRILQCAAGTELGLAGLTSHRSDVLL